MGTEERIKLKFLVQLWKTLKEVCDEVKDDSGRLRISTNRTEVNIGWARQVVCSNHQLTV